MKTRLTTLLLLMLAISTSLTGQNVLLEEIVPEHVGRPNYGANRKHFRHVLMGLSFPAETNPSKEVRFKTDESWDLYYGIRYKRKFSAIYAVGVDATLSRSAVVMSQDAGKNVPDTLLHKREKFVLLYPSVGVYQRINFDPGRGNYMGRFWDLGIYGSWHANIRHVTRDKIQGENIRMSRSAPAYFEPFSWGLQTRFGFNNLIIRANYRVSDIFKAEYGFMELPRFSVGIEFGGHF